MPSFVQHENEFQIFALGDLFDPDAYLTTSSLTLDGVWHKSSAYPDFPASSGVSRTLGDGTKLSQVEQERIAIDFLTSNRVPLKDLANHPDVETFVLGIQINFEMPNAALGFAVGASPDLMRLCADIGLSLVFYMCLQRELDR